MITVALHIIIILIITYLSIFQPLNQQITTGTENRVLRGMMFRAPENRQKEMTGHDEQTLPLPSRTRNDSEMSGSGGRDSEYTADNYASDADRSSFASDLRDSFGAMGEGLRDSIMSALSAGDFGDDSNRDSIGGGGTSRSTSGNNGISNTNTNIAAGTINTINTSTERSVSFGGGADAISPLKANSLNSLNQNTQTKRKKTPTGRRSKKPLDKASFGPTGQALIKEGSTSKNKHRKRREREKTDKLGVGVGGNGGTNAADTCGNSNNSNDNSNSNSNNNSNGGSPRTVPQRGERRFVAILDGYDITPHPDIERVEQQLQEVFKQHRAKVFADKEDLERVQIQAQRHQKSRVQGQHWGQMEKNKNMPRDQTSLSVSDAANNTNNTNDGTTDQTGADSDDHPLPPPGPGSSGTSNPSTATEKADKSEAEKAEKAGLTLVPVPGSDSDSRISGSEDQERESEAGRESQSQRDSMRDSLRESYSSLVTDEEDTDPQNDQNEFNEFSLQSLHLAPLTERQQQNASFQHQQSSAFHDTRQRLMSAELPLDQRMRLLSSSALSSSPSSETSRNGSLDVSSPAYTRIVASLTQTEREHAMYGMGIGMQGGVSQSPSTTIQAASNILGNSTGLGPEVGPATGTDSGITGIPPISPVSSGNSDTGTGTNKALTLSAKLSAKWAAKAAKAEKTAPSPRGSAPNSPPRNTSNSSNGRGSGSGSDSGMRSPPRPGQTQTQTQLFPSMAPEGESSNSSNSGNSNGISGAATATAGTAGIDSSLPRAIPAASPSASSGTEESNNNNNTDTADFDVARSSRSNERQRQSSPGPSRSPVTLYVGDPEYSRLSVVDNLELYVREQVFLKTSATAAPTGAVQSQLYLQAARPLVSHDPPIHKQGQGNPGDDNHSDMLDFMADLPPYLVLTDKYGSKMVRRTWGDSTEHFVALFEETVVNVVDEKAQRAARESGEKESRWGRKTASEAGSEKTYEELKLAIVLTSSHVYFIQMDVQMPKSVSFSDAPLLELLAAHSLDSLQCCVNYFGFQRCMLDFSGPCAFPDPAAWGLRMNELAALTWQRENHQYMVVTRDKSRTHPLITRIPQAANLARVRAHVD